jgi:hypothetical protein
VIIAIFLIGPILSQEIVKADTTLPFKIGPIIYDLPFLDSLSLIKNNTTTEDTSNYLNKITDIDQYPLNASGSFFRGINFGGNGNSALNGGLRMQIAGKISNETYISGVVTDESLPIQPDGATADLDELDKVFIHVDNPKFSIVAGDIETNEKKISINRFQRNLIGLNNKIQYKDKLITSVIGQTKGTYQRIEIKGKDGNQGPYYLTTVNGLSNIIISSGSEKVWLNGKLLKRGEDLDYIIDYSKGEVYFTSKNLIYFDSDIDIEYLYRQTNYATTYIETGIEGSFLNKSDFKLRYIRENQDVNSSPLSQNQKKQFNQLDEITIDGVYADSLGSYVLEDNVYIYDPQNIYSTQRYSVVFSPDNNGAYVRKISDKNRIFFEYSLNNLQDEQRFSPGQIIRAPNGNNILQFNSTVNTGSASSFFLESALSMSNINLYNQENSYNNGSAYRLGYTQDKITFQNLDLGFDVEHRMTSNTFRPLGRVRAVDFNETWDIDPLSENSELAISKFGANIGSKKTLIDIDLFDLKSSGNNRSRSQINIDHSSKFIKKADLTLNQINALQKFDQVNSEIIFFNGSVNPFVKFKSEHRYNGYRFEDMLAGIGATNKKRSFSIGIGKRSDWDFIIDKELMVLSKKARFVEFDYKYFDPKGWSRELTYRSRVQNNVLTNKTSSFGSGRLAVNYKKRTSPVRLDAIINVQNSIKEFASVVYDSVGIGRGSFRYDPILNEYIRDDKGSFIANNILTGSFKAGQNINSISRLSYDFSKNTFSILKFFKYRFTLNTNYHGSTSNMFEALRDRSAQMLMFNNRNELIYQKNLSSIRHRFSKESRINFNGMDLRGWQDKRSDIFRIDSQIPLSKNYFLKYDFNMHSFSQSTNNNYMLSRNVDGFYHELGLKKSSLKSFQYEIKATYFIDNVVSSLFDEHVYAYGLKTNFIKFIDNNGRIDCRVDYYDAEGFEGMPSEALKGISSNKTIRANLTSSIMIDQSLSVNTALIYTDSDRYDGFFQITGELRAYF